MCWTVTRPRPVARLVRVQIPAMLPAFFAAARMAGGCAASVLAVTVVEWLSTGSGNRQPHGAVGVAVGLRHCFWSAVMLVSALSALGYNRWSAGGAAVLATYAPEQLS